MKSRITILLFAIQMICPVIAFSESLGNPLLGINIVDYSISVSNKVITFECSLTNQTAESLYVPLRQYSSKYKFHIYEAPNHPDGEDSQLLIFSRSGICVAGKPKSISFNSDPPLLIAPYSCISYKTVISKNLQEKFKVGIVNVDILLNVPLFAIDRMEKYQGNKIYSEEIRVKDITLAVKKKNQIIIRKSLSKREAGSDLSLVVNRFMER